jgi:hypothetical protein
VVIPNPDSAALIKKEISIIGRRAVREPPYDFSVPNLISFHIHKDALAELADDCSRRVIPSLSKVTGPTPPPSLSKNGRSP